LYGANVLGWCAAPLAGVVEHQRGEFEKDKFQSTVKVEAGEYQGIVDVKAR
jgi:hypothetical protein